MANVGAKVTISAVDRVSSVVDRINGRLDRMRAPVDRMRASFGRFASLSGLSQLNNGMVRVSRSALGAFRTMGQIVPVLGTITSAASVAGLYRLSSAWARFGTDLRTASRAMGMEPQRLQAMRNAAQLAGGSGDAMGEALQQLSSTRWEAANGFAPEAAAQFQKLGISLQELQTIAPDKMFERVAKRIRETRDPAARTIAAVQIFGAAAQGLMPIFQQTERQYQANIRLAERYGVMNERGADAAANLQRSMTGLGLAAEGFGNSLAEAVEPALRPIIDGMAEWISANRTWISQDIAGYVGRFMAWLRNGGWQEIKGHIRDVYGEIKHVVDQLGGWQKAGRDALIVMAALYAAPVLGGLAQVAAAIVSIGTALTGIGGAAGIARLGLAGVAGYAVDRGMRAADPNDRFGSWVDTNVPGAAWVDDFMARHTGLGRTFAQQNASRRFFGAQTFRDYFVRQGWTAAQAEGLVANFDQESGFDFRRSGDNGSAFGIGQWHAPRQADFKRLFGHDIHQSRLSEQLAFAQWELTHTYASAGRALRMAQTPEDSAGIASTTFFRPRDRDAEVARRSSMAGGWHQALNAPEGQSVDVPRWQAPIVSTGPAVTVPPGNVGVSSLADTIQRLRVEIRHDNAPPGSSVRVTSTSPGLRVSGVSQSRAMSPDISGGGL
ncbi:phage tail protein [Gluconacetobacter sp. 1c LMG 22058]|uniref:Phage tail protein n=1 Tax=Gluconacetobacter dulcium TaxID=2729096 RepID=A0A7W4PJ47_9PROT|nr:phage tail tip lysozyme [Gluconacetobacter dulcium]MBB2196556.1 phage tail protein [Gluconacetobacter dulcium]